MSNIYNSFANVVKVTSELSALQQSARDLFQAPEGFGLSSFAWTPHEKFAEHEWVCVWAAIGATVFSEGQKKNRPIGRLLLCMDLFRQTSPAITRTVLPHSTESFLTCVFIAGNKYMETEITPLLIIFRLEEYQYAEAAALGFVMLAISFVMLLTINLLQVWGRKRMMVSR